MRVTFPPSCLMVMRASRISNSSGSRHAFFPFEREIVLDIMQIWRVERNEPELPVAVEQRVPSPADEVGELCGAAHRQRENKDQQGKTGAGETVVITLLWGC